jgi:hypothetical protein
MKLLFKFSSAVILFTAMLCGSGCKKSNDQMMTTPTPTPTFKVGLRADPNLGTGNIEKSVEILGQLIKEMIGRKISTP